MHALWAPLNQLLKKDIKWSWSSECQNAFEEIIRALMSDISLSHYDPKDIHIATDASNLGLGAILLYKEVNRQPKVVAYASRTLLPAEKNYSQIEKRSTKYNICSKKSFINFYMNEAPSCNIQPPTIINIWI